MAWAYRQNGIRPIAKFVLVTIADGGRIGFSGLCKLTGLRERELADILAELTVLDLVSTADAWMFQIARDREAMG